MEISTRRKGPPRPRKCAICQVSQRAKDLDKAGRCASCAATPPLFPAPK